MWLVPTETTGKRYIRQVARSVRLVFERRTRDVVEWVVAVLVVVDFTRGAALARPARAGVSKAKVVRSIIGGGGRMPRVSELFPDDLYTLEYFRAEVIHETRHCAAR